METHTDNLSLVLGGKRQNSVLNISETLFGYSISKGGRARTRANLGELAALSGCLFFGALSFGQWLIPNAVFAEEILPFQISGTIMFFVISALLYKIARRGLTVEAQIDTRRAMLRIVRRNRQGGTTLLTQVRFADIRSVFVKRSKSDFLSNQMFVRSSSGNAPILIASGPVRELEPLLDRLQRDFRDQLATAPKPRQQVKLRAPEAAPRRVFATG